MRETREISGWQRGMRAVVSAAGLVAVLGLSGCKSDGGSTGSVALNGAGSTFVYPAMSRWTANFMKSRPGVHVNYQSIGSGGGIQQVKAGTVDFGASDNPLNDAQLAGMKPMIQIPESAGPVCVTYNIPNLTQPLRLSAEAISGIFLGTITSWQDPAVAKDNPGVTLPTTPIVVSHRSDGSGTTNAFTTYLSAVSAAWKAKVGQGNAVQWPVGLGGKGSEGVTEQVRQSAGSIGYVELTYANQNKLPVAAVQNQAGHYILPDTGSTTDAVTAFSDQLQKDPRTPIVNPPASAPTAYPIATLTFLLIPKDGPDKARRTALKEFVTYVLGEGQGVANQLHYAPLPDSMRQYDMQLVGQLTAGGQPIQF